MLRLLALAPPLLFALAAVLASYVGPLGLVPFGICLAAAAPVTLWWLARVRAPCAAPPPRIWGHLFAVTATAVALHAFALTQSRLPPGVDAAFHCTVALHFLKQDRVTSSLRPLEDLDLNYPTASHGVVALLSRLASVTWGNQNVQPHTVFRWFYLLPILGAALLAAAAAQRTEQSGRQGMQAAAWVGAFGLFEATWFPYTWGGLPSSLAMWLVIAGLGAATWLRSPANTATAVFLWGAAALTHHHVAVALLAALGILSLLSTTRLAGRLPLLSAPRHAATCLTGTVLISAVYWLRLVANLGSAASTGLLSYVEPLEPPWQVAWHIGPIACLGLLAAAFDAHRGRLTAFEKLGLAFALVWLVAFALMAYAARALAEWWVGRPVSLFTPSRFMFEFQWALLPVAAAALSRRCGRRPWALAVLCVTVTVCWTWPRWTNEPLSRLPERVLRGQLKPPTGTIIADDFLLAPGRYVATHAPAEAVVVSVPGHVWLTYCTERESTGLFIPISEPLTARIRLKHLMSREPNRMSWADWSRRLGGVPIWGIYPRSWRWSAGQRRARFGPVDVLVLSGGTADQDRVR